MKPHICPLCQRSFSRPENLHRHRKTHDATLPHHCRQCGKRFSRSDLLKRHVAIHQKTPLSHHGAPGELVPNQSDAAASPRRPTPTSSSFDEGASPLTCSSNNPSPAFQAGGSVENAGSNSVFTIQQLTTNAIIHQQQQQHHHHHHHHGELAGPLEVGGMMANEMDNEMRNEVPALGEHASLNPYLDFMSFADVRHGLPPGIEDWFELEFYDATRDMAGPAQHGLLPPPHGSVLPSSAPVASIPPLRDQDQGISPHHEHLISPRPQRPAEQPAPEVGHGARRLSISRVHSPPNEASYEDYWPFAWNPRSAPISCGPPIQLSEDDELLRNHNPRYDISQKAWDRVTVFLERPGAQERGPFRLPTLPVANAFIGLYFRVFSPQAPVLHEPTVDTNTLPPPLLAIIMIIGAIYSNARHTRRFAIIALDRARYNLQSAIERDQILMREPHVIFAQALICYTLLWCGNKRTFEIAEVLRGMLVTYVRRLPKHHAKPADAHLSMDMGARWTSWVASESTKRIHWFVFMIDSQFPNLLNMKSMFSLAEVFRWECPCDEDFWSAPTARSWKSRLGVASQPPAPTFTTVLSPFLSLFASRHSMFSPAAPLHMADEAMLPLRINQWTAFLLLSAIASYAHEWSDDWMMAIGVMQETTDEENPMEALARTGEGTPAYRLLEARNSLLDALLRWHQSYGQSAQGFRTEGNPEDYFSSASLLLYHLTAMLLSVSLTDMQDAMGKSGPTCIGPTMRRLERWCERDESWPLRAADQAIRLIASADLHFATPYSAISVFLAHVLLWVLTRTASADLITKVREFVGRSEIPESTAHELGSLLRPAATHSSATGPEGAGGRCSIFQHGAGMLIRLGPWGSSLNLALLLHRRSELQDHEDL